MFGILNNKISLFSAINEIRSRRGSFLKLVAICPFLVTLLASGLSGCAHLQSPRGRIVCRQNPSDPFEPNSKMPGGQFKGECINTTHRRSIKILTEQEARAYGQPPDRVLIANVSNAGKFWIASIPRHLKIIGVDFVRTWLFIDVAHLAIHFRLGKSTPAVLLPQLLTDHSKPVKCFDLVFSLEALESRADPLPFISAAAFFGNYVAVYRMVTLKEFQEEKDQDLLHLWVHLPPKAREAFFWKLVQESNRNGLKTMFKVFTHNCCTIPLAALDSIMHYDQNTRRRISGKDWFDPTDIKSYLRARGIKYTLHAPSGE